MVVLRSFALFLLGYALVAMEATISHKYQKVGQREERREIMKGKQKRRKSKGQCPKTEGTLKRHRLTLTMPFECQISFGR